MDKLLIRHYKMYPRFFLESKLWPHKVNTPLYLNDTAIVKIIGIPVKNTVSWNSIFSLNNANQYNQAGVFLFQTNSDNGSYYYQISSNRTDFRLDEYIGKITEFEMTYTYLKANGNTIATKNQSHNYTNEYYWILAKNWSFNSISLWTDNQLIFNWIPCKISKGNVWTFIDTVSENFVTTDPTAFSLNKNYQI